MFIVYLAYPDQVQDRNEHPLRVGRDVRIKKFVKTLGLGFKTWGSVFENGEKNVLGVDFSFCGTYRLTYLLSNEHYFCTCF